MMYAGKVRWQQQQPPGLHATGPVLSVPDLDRDTVKDLALVASDNTQVNMAANSGPNASGKNKMTSFKHLVPRADPAGFPLGEDGRSARF